MVLPGAEQRTACSHLHGGLMAQHRVPVSVIVDRELLKVRMMYLHLWDPKYPAQGVGDIAGSPRHLFDVVSPARLEALVRSAHTSSL